MCSHSPPLALNRRWLEMVALDRRSEFTESDADLLAVAAEAHRLYESDEFRADVIEALAPVLREHLDAAVIDEVAEAVLTEWCWTDGRGGFFQLRNQIVTTAEADLKGGDIIRMESARSESETIIPFVVWGADPDNTGVRVWRIDPEDGEKRCSDLNAGLVHFVDRYDVDRSHRGDSAHAVADELAAAMPADD
jgi:hypothetical protein